MDDKIEITGLDRNEVLAALCNGTGPQGLGAMNSKAFDGVTASDCAAEFESRTERNGVYAFDYVFGRPIKVSFVTEGDQVFLDRVRLYDRDAGHGAAQAAVDALRGSTP